VFHYAEVVGADLVSESAAAGVDEDHDLSGLGDADLFGDFGVVDLIDGVDFEEVVAGSEAAGLGHAAAFGVCADFCGVGLGHVSVFFAVFGVFLPAVAVFDCPVDAVGEGFVEFGWGEADFSF